MHKFSIGIEDYYKRFPYDTPRIKACMSELIDRYEIAGKSVLSVGAGTGDEERHFAFAGNDLLLIDIDEQGTFLPILKKFSRKHGMNVWIGDAAEVGPHDVIYLSGFTPDEFRRQAIVRANADAGERPWSLDDEPFHHLVMNYARKLKDAGLLIVQSYAGGVDTAYNPQYIGACQIQLHKAGLSLLEVHRFKRSRGTMLYTAVKGPSRLAPETPLKKFHGRGVAEPVERIFPERDPKQTMLRTVNRRVRRTIRKYLLPKSQIEQARGQGKLPPPTNSDTRM